MTRTKPGFYAVRVGREPGVYLTWEQCSAQVKGYSGCIHKKFPTFEEAQAFVGRGATGPANSPAQMSSLVEGFGRYDLDDLDDD
ncbi:hypothetical protein JCM3766R1_000024 [Sporobolomyces carnicolor]